MHSVPNTFLFVKKLCNPILHSVQNPIFHQTFFWQFEKKKGDRKMEIFLDFWKEIKTESVDCGNV